MLIPFLFLFSFYGFHSLICLVADTQGRLLLKQALLPNLRLAGLRHDLSISNCIKYGISKEGLASSRAMAYLSSRMSAEYDWLQELVVQLLWNT